MAAALTAGPLHVCRSAGHVPLWLCLLSSPLVRLIAKIISYIFRLIDVHSLCDPTHHFAVRLHVRTGRPTHEPSSRLGVPVSSPRPDAATRHHRSGCSRGFGDTKVSVGCCVAALQRSSLHSHGKLVSLNVPPLRRPHDE